MVIRDEAFGLDPFEHRHDAGFQIVKEQRLASFGKVLRQHLDDLEQNAYGRLITR